MTLPNYNIFIGCKTYTLLKHGMQFPFCFFEKLNQGSLRLSSTWSPQTCHTSHTSHTHHMVYLPSLFEKVICLRCTSSIRGQDPLARGFYAFIVPQDASPGAQPNSLPQPLACFHEFRWALLEFLTLSVTGLLQTRFSGPWDDHGEALGADQSSAASR